MKIYLDNNLGVANVEQEELTQDTIGYNILKVYIPNAVLTPYDTFTCYYGALLQNGRKVGWFAMEARTSSDADYEANYTLYKATLEQCIVSVEGKVYIGCQVLLGNSGNATLIKKNTAVVQFNVRKSVAINNDILVLDTDQTTTDVLESYKNLLENALLTYATKAEVYTKTQIDALLLQKADKATTYNKDEVNSALALKADKSNTYTKQESDNIFAPKSTAITHTGNQLQDYSGNNIYPNLDDGQVNYSTLDTKLEESLNLIFDDTSLTEYQKDSGYKYIYNSQYNIFGETTNQWSDAIVYQVEKGKIYKLKSFQRANTLIYGFCANIPTTSQPYTPLNSDYLYGGEESATKEYILKAPENCYLLVTVVNNSTKHGLYELDKIRSKIENVDLKDITTAKSVQETIHIGLSTDIYNDYIYTNTGTTDSSSTTYKSKDTEIIKNAIEIKITKTIGVLGGAFLDENKNWISSFSASTLGTTYTIPSNAKYVNLTINITSTGNGFDFITQRYEIVNLYVPFDENSIMPSQWYGKKIVCIGTSVSFGSNATESYIHYASQKMGFNLINASVPGQAIQTDSDGTSMTYGSTTLSISEYASEGITIADAPLPYVAGGNYNNYYRTWEHIFNIQDVDLYVFDVVPNNTNFDMTDWNDFNRNTWAYNTGTFADHRKTFLGALLYLLDKMYTANSKARIVLVISSSFRYLDGKRAFETIANSYNIPIINLWGKVTTTPPSLQVLKSLGGNDNHPSTFAHECMGKMFVGELLKIA